MKQFFFVIITYIFLFSPIFPWFSTMGSVKFLYILFPLLFVPVYYKDIKKIRYLIWANIASLLYVIIVSNLSPSTGSKIVTNSVVIFVEDIFLAYIMVKLHLRNGVRIQKTLFWCLIIASVSAVMCMIFPPIKTFVNNFLSIPLKVNDVLFIHRGFGICSEYNYSYGFIMAFLFVFLYYWGYHKRWLTILLPIVSLAILINARVGMTIIMWGIIFLLITKKRESISLVAVLILFIASMFGAMFMGSVQGETVDFVQQFFYTLSDIFMGTSYRSSNEEIGDAIISGYSLPFRTLQDWVFGMGLDYGGGFVYMTSYYTDNGFVRELAFGGITYLTLLLFNIIIPLFTVKESQKRYFIIFLLVSAVILNIKGPFLMGALGSKAFMFMLIFFMLTDNGIKTQRIKILEIKKLQ